ncbi:UDP-N-acetylmuramoyl-tripeptide--D-alanyl-D-alanine ligase [Defluviimonas sp. WL0002]|uniref:UDP-N-acetylmuramoyl-tripeptide--D-alanyl-D-alanine ligase n=1 Tax=Albidovulum marisflavi TaxID=2984159 RepID=A0ABT2ZCX5_9RHOB|nr:UDP-N-acetylmuramoyl-tripeptide--D-alanyl-D-alanine ligase [Defluviimonas sp. WL0002]MCV2868977.1 UDP-N-acetylmuramoyl-tripeptide--D-alanyl-D-alanine ligase [Defluviimonas sp. WL0002]
MEPIWTASEAEAATGGRATRDFAATGVSIDTRTLQPGDLFVALKDVRDGHDFVADALKKGAAAAFVSRIPEGCDDDAPLLIVPDVLEALEALGRAGRARSSARVVAVTGSVGKTSTKEMLRAVLAAQGKVHAAEASYNNHWGVPLTLARLPRDADFAVIEIGMNHPGEIAPLSRIARPHVAMITTVAPVHLEAFEDGVEGIAREKAAIFEGLERGGIAVIPSGLSVTPILADAAAIAARTIRFGAEADDDWRLVSVTLSQDATVVKAEHTGQVVLFKLRTAGRHFAANALGVLAAAAALGADPAIAACDLGLWAPPAGRGTRERIQLDIVDETLSFDLIDDAFNANPASMAAALDVLGASLPRDGVGRRYEGRRIAILGDMLELGPTEAALHADLARHPMIAGLHLIHCVGPRMRHLWTALPATKRGEWHETAAELAQRSHQIVDAGDVVLVKGSKGSKVSMVVDGLRKLGQPVAYETRGTD